MLHTPTSTYTYNRIIYACVKHLCYYFILSHFFLTLSCHQSIFDLAQFYAISFAALSMCAQWAVIIQTMLKQLIFKGSWDRADVWLSLKHRKIGALTGLGWFIIHLLAKKVLYCFWFKCIPFLPLQRNIEWSTEKEIQREIQQTKRLLWFERKITEREAKRYVGREWERRIQDL